MLMLSLSKDAAPQGPGSYRAATISLEVSGPVVWVVVSPPHLATASAGLQIQLWRLGAGFGWERSCCVTAGVSQQHERGCIDHRSEHQPRSWSQHTDVSHYLLEVSEGVRTLHCPQPPHRAGAGRKMLQYSWCNVQGKSNRVALQKM